MSVDARRSQAVQTFHGIAVPDPYDWLEDAASSETKAWRAAQGALTARVLSGLPDRERFRNILNRTRLPLEGLPIHRRGITFSFGVSENGGATVLSNPEGARQVVFDPAQIEALHPLRLQHAFLYPSPSGRYLAVGLAKAGSDWLQVRLFDVERDALLPTIWVETVHPVIDWLPDESGFFYNTSRSRFTKSDVPDGVYRHRLGRPVSEDTLVFEHAEGVPGHASLPIVVRNGSLLLIKTIDFVTQKSALHALPINGGAPRELLGPQQRYNLVGELREEILLESDLDAPRGRIVALNPTASSPGLREIVPQREETLEMSTHSTRAHYSVLAGERVYATYVQDVTSRVLVFTRDGDVLGEAAIGGLFTVLRIEVQGGVATVSVTRFNTPYERYRLKGTTAIALPADEPESDLAVDAQQIFCTSDDGTRIPMFVVRPPGARGPLPTLLYGYGGWGSSLTPCFRPDLAAWVQRGGAYAIVNTRGGGEYGEAWHEAGARLNRIKTFEDFCAAAEALMERGICREGALAARGLSNGGLLVSACSNRCPERFAAVSASVPLVDVVNLLKLPAGTAIAQELGDPTASRAAFDYMHSYSPLQNVKPNDHRPAMLILPAELDDRVSASQGYKFVAALQATAAPGQVALLRVVEGEGHTTWPESMQRDVLADELAFLWSFVAAPGKRKDAA